MSVGQVVPKRVLSPLRLPFRHGAEVSDSPEDRAILEAIRERDWGRLGGLLGAVEPELGLVVAAWPRLSPRQRTAFSQIVGP
jgi:hypothetical protein